METTKITVQSCTKMREKDGKSIFAIGLTDGRGGESFNQAIPVGTDISALEITESQWGLKFKLKSATGLGGFRGAGRTYNEAEKFPGFALAYSKDLVVAGKVDLKDILNTANKFHKWLADKHKALAPAPTVAAPATQAAAAPAGPAVNGPDYSAPGPPAPDSTDDLPF
jgi:hypothetical protein